MEEAETFFSTSREKQQQRTKSSQNFVRILFGSQEVQKMEMKMEIRKRKMDMIQKETF